GEILQLVGGVSPLAAGAWMGPLALAMVLAGIAAPLIARRIRPGHVVAGAHGLSSLGYLLLAAVDSGIGLVVGGFSLAYLGLGTIAALGTDLVVGAAPPDKDRKSTRLNSSHVKISYAVFCLKKKRA